MSQIIMVILFTFVKTLTFITVFTFEGRQTVTNVKTVTNMKTCGYKCKMSPLIHPEPPSDFGVPHVSFGTYHKSEIGDAESGADIKIREQY